MSFAFNPYAALARIRAGQAAIPAIPATAAPEMPAAVATVAALAGSAAAQSGTVAALATVAAAEPALADFEERAAIAEHDGGLTRDAAEMIAAREQGFADPAALHAAAVAHWLRELQALRDRERTPEGRTCIGRALAFLRGGWGEKALALGWTEETLVGACPVAPWNRLDRLGAAYLAGDTVSVTARAISTARRLVVPRWRGDIAAAVPWTRSTSR